MDIVQELREGFDGNDRSCAFRAELLMEKAALEIERLRLRLNAIRNLDGRRDLIDAINIANAAFGGENPKCPICGKMEPHTFHR